MPGWANLTLVTDAEIGQIEPQATSSASPSPWGATTWTSARAEAKRELKIWLELAFPEIPGVADRVVDIHAADYVLSSSDAGVAAFTDITSQANDDDEKDVDLEAIFATADGRLYVGAAYQFEGLFLRLLDELNGSLTRTLTVKYWGATGWTALTITDGTAVSNRAFGQTGRVTWTIPSGWEARTLNGTGDEYFWVELSLSDTLTVDVKASQILPIRAPDGLKRVAAYLSLYFILNGLASQSVRPDDWEKKAKDYELKADKLFTQLKERGGIPIDVNRDQKTSNTELRETKPLRLGRA